MRTREEQISQLSCAIFNKRPGDIDECIALARKYILEAERRAEQRVRAEIARDSERLDWMQKSCAAINLNTTHHIEMGWGFRLNGKFGKNIRRAIDAARVNTND